MATETSAQLTDSVYNSHISQAKQIKLKTNLSGKKSASSPCKTAMKHVRILSTFRSIKPKLNRLYYGVPKTIVSPFSATIPLSQTNKKNETPQSGESERKIFTKLKFF